MSSNRARNIKRQCFLELDQLVNIYGFLAISTTHHDIVKLLVVWQLLPLGSDDLVPLLALELRVLSLDQGDLLTSEKTIGGHEPELSRGFDGLVVAAKLDLVDSSPKVADLFFGRFKFAAVAFEPFLCLSLQFLSLQMRDLVVPS